MFKSSGNITKSGSGSILKVRTSPAHGWAVRAEIPTSPDGNTTFLLRVLTSDNGTAFKEAARDENGAGTRSTGVGRTIIVPFGTRKKYVTVGWTLSATGSANHGAVKIGLVPYDIPFNRAGLTSQT